MLLNRNPSLIPCVAAVVMVPTSGQAWWTVRIAAPPDDRLALRVVSGDMAYGAPGGVDSHYDACVEKFGTG